MGIVLRKFGWLRAARIAGPVFPQFAEVWRDRAGKRDRLLLMYSVAIEALLEMGEYIGVEDGFLGQSIAKVREASKCPPEDAKSILQDLRDHGIIDLEISPAGELPITPTEIPLRRCRWYVRQAA